MKKFFSTFKTGSLIVGSLLATSILFTACNKFDNDDNDNTPVAGLMAFNLVPDKSAVTVALSGNALGNAPLAYSSYTGVYLPVFPGSRTVETYDNSSTPFATTTTTFEAEKFYSAFVVGANGNYRNVVLRDNFDSLSGASGQAYIRYINAIPDSSNPTVKITAGGSDVVNAPASFASVSEFTAVAPGQVTIDISNGGNIDADRTITLEARKIYTVLLAGIPGDAVNGVQIRFVANGELDETAAGQRVSSSARVSSAN
jgi:hypothetical protein